jgi:hypothetical protein
MERLDMLRSSTRLMDEVYNIPLNIRNLIFEESKNLVSVVDYIRQQFLAGI